MMPEMSTQLIETVIRWIALISSYAIIGGGLKYIDQVYDIRVFNRYVAWLLAVLCGLLMGTLIAIDPSSAAILLAIIFGVGIARKLDTTPFVLITLMSLGVPAILSIFDIFPEYEFKIRWVPLAVLIFSALADEYMDDVGDKRKMKILTIRPVMKIAVLTLCAVRVFDWAYFFALMAFDITYMIIKEYSIVVAINKTSLRRGANHILTDR